MRLAAKLAHRMDAAPALVVLIAIVSVIDVATTALDVLLRRLDVARLRFLAAPLAPSHAPALGLLLIGALLSAALLGVVDPDLALAAPVVVAAANPRRIHAVSQQLIDLRGEATANLARLEVADLAADAREAILAKDDALAGQIATLQREHDALQRAHARERNELPVRVSTLHVRAEDDPMRGFASAADFGRSVHAACRPAGGILDPRLATLAEPGMIGAAPTNFHEEGHSTDGYMVPPQMRQEIWTLMFEQDDLLSQVETEPTDSNAISGLADESTPWGATGIKAYWTGEGAQGTQSRLSTEERIVRLHKLAALVLATDELLEDAPRLNQRLTVGAARAMAWESSEAIMWGTGAGKPMGWMVAPSKIAVPKETNQAAATILPANITKMFTRILGGPGARLAWKANRDIVPQLVDLRLGNEPSWVQANGGLRDAPNGLLLGVPVQFTEHAHTLGTEGDLQLVNLAGYYATVKRSGVQFANSIHLYFDYSIQAFRWTFRLGGQPFLKAAVSPARGTTTKSHFVSLATRA